MTTETETLEERRERMARVRSFRGGKGASVDIVENPRVQSTSYRNRAAAAEAFVARNEERQESSRETGPDGVVIEHNRPGTVVMYKPTETQGYVPRTVSVSSMRLLLGQGWQEHCPLCGKDHIDKLGHPSTDPNLCSARPPVAVRVSVASVSTTTRASSVRREAPSTMTRTSFRMKAWS